ncbi:MAG: nucleotidyltransferase domain-containing protein [Euryarchaeota archaeon]|nr:nucleotidyltransferase domain-containing protein [Euryarchaeota archaeon]
MPPRSLSSAEKIYRNKKLILQELRKGASRALKDSSVTQVILFGSLAGDNFGLYSDADLLLVLEESKYKRFFDRIPEFLDYFTNVPIPVDLFPYKEDEIEKMKNSGNRLILMALKEGVVLAGKLREK